jgi:hypothetical protein
MVLDRRVDATGRKPGVRVFLEEGNFTYNAELDTIKGELPGGSFASRIGKNTEVQIYTGADRTVQVFSNGIHIGATRTKPEGELPKASKTSGNYQRRTAGIDLVGEFEWLPLVDDNAAINPGDYLALANAKQYDKEEDAAAQPTALVAFESRDSSEGGSILAIRLGNQSQFEAD